MPSPACLRCRLPACLSHGATAAASRCPADTHAALLRLAGQLPTTADSDCTAPLPGSPTTYLQATGIQQVSLGTVVACANCHALWGGAGPGLVL